MWLNLLRKQLNVSSTVTYLSHLLAGPAAWSGDHEALEACPMDQPDQRVAVAAEGPCGPANAPTSRNQRLAGGVGVAQQRLGAGLAPDLG